MRRIKNFVCVVALIVVAMLLIGAMKPEKASEYVTYTVQQGDTLWSISKELTPDSRDLRYTIREIEEVNDLQNCTIRVGQVLTVPVYEE